MGCKSKGAQKAYLENDISSLHLKIYIDETHDDIKMRDSEVEVNVYNSAVKINESSEIKNKKNTSEKANNFGDRNDEIEREYTVVVCNETLKIQEYKNSVKIHTDYEALRKHFEKQCF